MAAPETCAVTGMICNADGSLLAGAQVLATIRSTKEDQGGQVAGGVGVNSEPIEAFTEEDGTFAIDLIQGAIVLLQISSINLRKEVQIPEAATVDFVSLI